MSGFVGIVHLDGAPADQELLRRLTESINYRGPDSRNKWVHDSVAFGHTMLRTTFEAQRERQPCSLDNESWITADCRVDAREDLIAELSAHGHEAAKDATDPELILHAYAVWGTECVQHLIGDFAFAIWDKGKRRLFCARDQMGVKLFYYARKSNCLIVGNTINCLRLHPCVTDRLNDAAIGDFLLFGSNSDPETTSFEDIRCLPPSHTFVWPGGGTAGEPQTKRYWTLPVDPPLRYRRSADYTDHFLELLRTAVRDRLRTKRVGLFMSGGLDSSGIAAIAKELAGEPPSIEYHAHTAVYDRLIPDDERRFAGIAAAHLRIPIQFHPRDDDGIYEACGGCERQSADPSFITEFGPDPVLSIPGAIARQARVALYGEGPDNALHYEWKPYVKYELARGHIANVIWETLSFPWVIREVPFLGRFRNARRNRGNSGGKAFFPAWLNKEFVNRLDLRERFERMNGTHGGEKAEHPIRPAGHGSFLTYAWRAVFESHDPGITHVPLEVRHPYVDVRMLKFLLAVPVIPWCRGKYLLRRALHPYLPTEVIVRPKTALQGFPSFVSWERARRPLLVRSDALADYVDVKLLMAAVNDSPTTFLTNLRPHTLDIFLRKLAG